MYVIVLLKTEPLQFTVLPLSWIAKLDVAQIFNYGISHTKLHRVFYSPNTEDDPNFKLDIQNIFGENTPANFMATMHSVWNCRDDAINHMGTRRRLLPAIYNANLERYHWTPPDAANAAAVKLEQEGMIWIRDITIDLLDSEDENEPEDVNQPEDINGAIGLEPVNLFEVVMEENELFINGANELEFGDVPNLNDVHVAQTKEEPNIEFPNMPNIIIDLTENKELIRNIIAFRGSDKEKEFDCQLNWIGEFPGPKVIKVENGPEDRGPLPMVNNIELKIDPLLGKLAFQIDPIDESRSIELDGHIIKMPKDLYVVMLHFNDYPAYKLDYFDSKFVSVLAASYIRVDEVKNGLIKADDIRMKLCLEIFRFRVKGDEQRMNWFNKFIKTINVWITGN